MSSEESRTFHVVVVETTLSASLATSFFFGGMILDHTSYRSVAALGVAINSCTVVYTLARIAEISRRRTGDKGVTCAQFCASVCQPRELKKMAAIVTRKREQNRRLYIIVILGMVVSAQSAFQRKYRLYNYIF